MIGVIVWWVYLAPQNIPRAISVLTLGNKVVLYYTVSYYDDYSVQTNWQSTSRGDRMRWLSHEVDRKQTTSTTTSFCSWIDWVGKVDFPTPCKQLWATFITSPAFFFFFPSYSSGAVWESRWTSWTVRPNEPSGFRGRKDLLNRASALVTTCP